jgi:predicted DNA-binding mobile mystery protein A
MTTRQLGARLGLAQQSVAAFEEAERRDAITLASLRKVAEAMECDLVYHFVPRGSFEEIVGRQARSKARETRNRLAHSMALEDQSAGVEHVLAEDERDAIDRWKTTQLRRLWD